MKQLKIQEQYFNDIESGLRTFDIRKEGDLEGIVELIVYREEKHKWTLNSDNNHINNKCAICGEILNHLMLSDKKDCIKKRLKVKLTKIDMTAYEIACRINNKIWANNEADNKLGLMYQKIEDFIIDWFNQGDTLYWYNLEIIKEKE